MLQRRFPRPLWRLLRAWRSGLRACLPNRRCSVRSRPPAPTCHRLVPRVRRFQRRTSRVELPLAGPNSIRTKFLGASPSWSRRRILIPVIAGSSPAALTNSSRGLGREGAGSHKAGVTGSTPVPATISGGSGTGWTRCVRRSPTAHYEIGGHSISPDFVQWQDARLWTGRRGVRFSQSGPDAGLVQW